MAVCQNELLMKKEKNLDEWIAETDKSNILLIDGSNSKQGDFASSFKKRKGISGFPLKVLQSLRDSLLSMYDDLTQS